MRRRELEVLERIATALELLVEAKGLREGPAEERLLEQWERSRRLERRLKAYHSARGETA